MLDLGDVCGVGWKSRTTVTLQQQSDYVVPHLPRIRGSGNKNTSH